MEDIDILRSAHLYMKKHGKNASFEVILRADELLAEGAMTGYRVMLKIVDAIKELECKEIN